MVGQMVGTIHGVSIKPSDIDELRTGMLTMHCKMVPGFVASVWCAPTACSTGAKRRTILVDEDTAARPSEPTLFSHALRSHARPLMTGRPPILLAGNAFYFLFKISTLRRTRP
jgi:hypothetical protein